MGDDAVKKLRDLTNAASTCMFGTGLHQIPFHVCPMQVQQVDEAGNLWFFSDATSIHNRQLEADSRTHLIFGNPQKIEYLTIYGETTISRDRTKIDELWTKLAEAWFPEGKEDPNLTVLRVHPIEAHYWDTENGKLITFAKMLTAAVTGNPNDSGSVQGDIMV